MPSKKMWVFSPPKAKKPKVPDSIKQELSKRADEIVETVLKPKCIKPPPTDNDFNHIVDIYTKWYRNYFYFCAKYNCPGPNAISPSFEDKFARLEYTQNGLFDISYMRHTEQWAEVFQQVSMTEALRVVAEEPYFECC